MDELKYHWSEIEMIAFDQELQPYREGYSPITAIEQYLCDQGITVDTGSYSPAVRYNKIRDYQQFQIKYEFYLIWKGRYDTARSLEDFGITRRSKLACLKEKLKEKSKPVARSSSA